MYTSLTPRNNKCIENLILMYLGQNSLISASKVGYNDVVRFLVENKADVNASDNHGKLDHIYIWSISTIFFTKVNAKDNNGNIYFDVSLM